MKQSFLIVCMMFAVTLYACGQGYVINGEVSGAEGQTVSLKQFRDLQPVEIGTTTVKGGKFTLKGNLPNPEFCMLYVGDQGPVQFFAENSNIRVLVDLGNINQSKVSGSKENEVYAEFVENTANYDRKLKKLTESYAALSASNTAPADTLTGIRAQFEKLMTERIGYTINFVSQKYPGKISSAFIVIANNLIPRLDMVQLEQIVQGYHATVAQSQWVAMLKDRVASLKLTAVGQPFSDITLKTPDDQPISISDYAGKGKYVLLDFWAAWCGPCRNANPRVVELYKHYKDKGFEIVGISLDQNKDAWLKAIKDDNLAWPQMSDLKYWQSAAAKLYSVNSIPHTVLLDRDGKIIAKGLYVDELAEKLAELFDK